MSKDDLKHKIEELELNEEIKSLIFELIDGAKEVNAELLSAVADMLDTQADIEEMEVNMYEDQIRMYDEELSDLQKVNPLPEVNATKAA